LVRFGRYLDKFKQNLSRFDWIWAKPKSYISQKIQSATAMLKCILFLVCWDDRHELEHRI